MKPLLTLITLFASLISLLFISLGQHKHNGREVVLAQNARVTPTPTATLIPLESNPESEASAFINRGVAYARLGEYDQAIADYAQAIQINPNDELPYFNRASAYANLGEFNRAIADYSRCIEMRDALISLCYFLRGLSHEYLGLYDEAVADYYSSIEEYPARARVYERLGSILYSQGRCEEALQVYLRYMREITYMDIDKAIIERIRELRAGLLLSPDASE